MPKARVRLGKPRVRRAAKKTMPKMGKRRGSSVGKTVKPSTKSLFGSKSTKPKRS